MNEYLLAQAKRFFWDEPPFKTETTTLEILIKREAEKQLKYDHEG